jgi:DNA-binding response OmpR family regulator
LTESNGETIVLVGQNLFFLGRVETQAEPFGYEVQWAKTRSAFREHSSNRQPTLILVDLEGDESIWTGVLEDVGHQEPGRVKVVAFGPHEDVDMLERARNLGCDLVMNKGEFNRDFPKMLGGGLQA